MHMAPPSEASGGWPGLYKQQPPGTGRCWWDQPPWDYSTLWIKRNFVGTNLQLRTGTDG